MLKQMTQRLDGGNPIQRYMEYATSSLYILLNQRYNGATSIDWMSVYIPQSFSRTRPHNWLSLGCARYRRTHQIPHHEYCRKLQRNERETTFILLESLLRGWCDHLNSLIDALIESDSEALEWVFDHITSQVIFPSQLSLATSYQLSFLYAFMQYTNENYSGPARNLSAFFTRIPQPEQFGMCYDFITEVEKLYPGAFGPLTSPTGTEDPVHVRIVQSQREAVCELLAQCFSYGIPVHNGSGEHASDVKREPAE